MWLYHDWQVNMQIGSGHKHRNIRLARNKRYETKKQVKIAREYCLPANLVEVEEPVVAHIISTSYIPEEATNTRRRRNAFLLLRQKIRHVDNMNV